MKLIVTTAWFLLCLSWTTVPATAQTIGYEMRIMENGEIACFEVATPSFVKNGRVKYGRYRRPAPFFSKQIALIPENLKKLEHQLLETEDRLLSEEKKRYQETRRSKAEDALENLQKDESGVWRLKKEEKFTEEELIKKYKKLRFNDKIKDAIDVLGGRLPENGPYFEQYPNSEKKKSEGRFKIGRPDGLWIWWDENGQTRTEGRFKIGRPDDLWTWYYENGQKASETHYEDGKLASASSWKPDGAACPITKIVDGAGIIASWHDNGKKASETHYKDGLKDGLTTCWDNNGHKRDPLEDGERVDAK